MIWVLSYKSPVADRSRYGEDEGEKLGDGAPGAMGSIDLTGEARRRSGRHRLVRLQRGEGDEGRRFTRA